jgi:hypothetical protein
MEILGNSRIIWFVSDFFLLTIFEAIGSGVTCLFRMWKSEVQISVKASDFF